VNLWCKKFVVSAKLWTVVNDRPLKMQWSLFWGLKAQIKGLNYFVLCL